jgi:predicted permease
LAARLLPPGPIGQDLLGDLEELYSVRAASASKLGVDLWFLREVLLAAFRLRMLAAGDRRRAPAAERRLRAGPPHQLAETARELSFAARRLRRSPGFAFAAVLTLALGIGASAAVLTVVYCIVLRPLPYPDADRLVVIEHELPGFDMPSGRTATFGGQYAQLAHYLERSKVFEEIGGFAAFDAALADDGDPQFLRMATATAGFFRAVGLAPLAGRLFDDQDPAPSASVVSPSLLTQGLWSQRFGQDPGVLGRLLRAQGFEHEIVGVLPAPLTFPPERVNLWASLPVSELHDKPWWTLTLMLGRLAPGATPERARDELNELIAELPDRFASGPVRRVVVEGRLRAKVTPLHTWLVGDVERSLWLLLAAVGGVLAIACVNVTNLILVRSEARRREVALRRAVGASSGQLARYFLADSVALVTLSAAAGTALAWSGVGALLRFGPSSLPRLDAVGTGWHVVAFSAVPALACLAIFALVPWLAGARAPSSGLREGRHTTSGRAQLRTRHLLVSFQLAMALVLLVGAGLIVRSFVALNRVDLGFEDRGVLTFRVVFPFQEIRAAGAAGDGPATPFYDLLAERLTALPGVEAVGYGTCVPLSDACNLGGYSLRREDRPETGDTVPATLALMVSPGYLPALQVPLLEGRHLEHRDHLERTNAAVISEETAQLFFPGESPLGRRLVQDGTPWEPFTVVGVVGDVRHEDPRKTPTSFIYLPVLGDFAPYERWAVSYVVRASGTPLVLVEAIRHEVEALRPDIPVAYVETLSGLVAKSTARLRFTLWLLALAAAATLALSAIGAYGVMAYVVVLRRNELGIRLALGADGRQLRTLVLRQGVTTAAAGVLVGLLGAAVGARALRSLLFETAPSDPLTYVVVIGGLALTALAAVYLPARRASRLDPGEVLRGE